MDTTSRRQIFSTLSVGTAVAALGASTANTAAAAPPVTQSLTTAVSGFVSGVGGYVGTLTVNSIGIVNGVLTAAVTFTGSVLNAAGAIVNTGTQSFTVPLQVSGSCQILSLTLGPLHLDLLGLVIDLNQVVLTITAVPGAGNLLGTLLCAVANLLNNPGTLTNLLTQLTTLLNQILAAL